MSLRSLFVAASLSVLVLAPGCQTPRSEQARIDANNRVNRFQANAVYDQARQEFLAGKLERALGTIDRAILGDDRADFHVLKGRILLEDDRLERSVEAFEKAIEVQAAAVTAIREQIEVRQEETPLEPRLLDQIEDQIEDARRIEAEAHYYIGIIQQRWSQDGDALASYEAAFELDQERMQYLAAQAEMLLAMNEPAKAEAIIERELQRFEGDASLLHLLGQAAVMRGDLATAESMLAEARIVRPDDASILADLVQVRFDAGMFDDCLESLPQLIALTPGDDLHLRRMEARCLAMTGRAAEANVAYRDLVRRSARDASLWIEHGAVAWEVGDLTRVALCGTRITTLAPDRWEGWFYRAMAAMERDRSDEAIELLRESARRAENAALPHLILGRALEDRGDMDGAQQAFADALKVEADSAEVQSVRGSVDRLIDG